jgi:hypothetical protein
MSAPAAATATTAATPASTIMRTSASTSAAAAAICAPVPAWRACFMAWFVTIEVRLTFGFFGEVAAAFDGHCRSAAFLRRRFSATHLRALLFQNRFARNWGHRASGSSVIRDSHFCKKRKGGPLAH